MKSLSAEDRGQHVVGDHYASTSTVEALLDPISMHGLCAIRPLLFSDTEPLHSQPPYPGYPHVRVESGECSLFILANARLESPREFFLCGLLAPTKLPWASISPHNRASLQNKKNSLCQLLSLCRAAFLSRYKLSDWHELIGYCVWLSWLKCFKRLQLLPLAFVPHWITNAVRHTWYWVVPTWTSNDI